MSAEPDYANMWPQLTPPKSARYVCTKKTYPDKKAAITARNACMNTGRVEGSLRIYPCRPCNGWHLSHKC